MVTDTTGRYMSLIKWHLIGLELGISIASVGLRAEPTGAAICFNADVPAIAKANLKAGSILDGEGGFTIYGEFGQLSFLLLKTIFPWTGKECKTDQSR